jgi:hypothetical protein
MPTVQIFGINSNKSKFVAEFNSAFLLVTSFGKSRFLYGKKDNLFYMCLTKKEIKFGDVGYFCHNYHCKKFLLVAL